MTPTQRFYKSKIQSKLKKNIRQIFNIRDSDSSSIATAKKATHSLRKNIDKTKFSVHFSRFRKANQNHTHSRGKSKDTIKVKDEKGKKLKNRVRIIINIQSIYLTTPHQYTVQELQQHSDSDGDQKTITFLSPRRCISIRIRHVHSNHTQSNPRRPRGQESRISS